MKRVSDAVDLHIDAESQQVSFMCDPFLTQDTGKLRIGTYTGDLQHGTVYSGGETHNS